MATVSKTVEGEYIGRANPEAGYVDWGAIFAGAVVATAISVLLVTFGSALGMSLTSFSNRPSLPGVGIVIAIGLWLMWLQVSAALGGGYIAGRLRRRVNDAQNHEVEMRDGMHGLVVWALGLIIGALIAAATATVGTIGASAVSGGALANSKAVDPGSYYVDRLLRPATESAPAAGGSTTGSSQSATPAATPESSSRTISADTRSEFGRLLALGKVTSAESEDRAYLLRRMVAETGLTEQAAAERLDSTLTAMKAAADQARRMAVLMAFITAVSLLISALAAWWAATKGGDHRDNAVDHSTYIRIR